MAFHFRGILTRATNWGRDLALRTRASPVAAVLVGTNLLAGVLAVLSPAGAASLLFVYWAETVVLGLLNILKIYWVPARGLPAGWHPVVRFPLIAILGSLMAAVFLLHYGFFTLVTGGLILSLGAWGFGLSDESFPPFGRVLMLHIVPVAVLAASHLHSFVTNFIGNAEWREADLEDGMERPYKRLMLMMVITWPGIILADKAGASLLVIAVVFVPVKIIADLVGYFQEHRTGA